MVHDQTLTKMKTKYLILSLLFLSLSIRCQTYINGVIGIYLCTQKYYNGATLTSTCTCHLLLEPTTSYSLCVFSNDSCFGQNWIGSSPGIEVKSDSTFVGNPTIAAADGKLYSNDSIHLSHYFACKPSYNCRKVFDGHKLYSTASVDELQLPENALLISPNPANEVLYLQSTQVTFDKTGPLLFDARGARVKTETVFINSATYKINTAELPPGIYFVMVQTSNGYLRKKFVKD